SGCRTSEAPVGVGVVREVVSLIHRSLDSHGLTGLESRLGTGGSRHVVDVVGHTGLRRNRDDTSLRVEGRSRHSSLGTTAGAEDNLSPLVLRQRTGHTTLNQVLVLVEVDVEVLERGDLATARRADSVVRQVDKNHQDVVAVMLSVFHDRNQNDAVNLEGVGQLCASLPQPTTYLRSEERRL